MTNLSRIFGPSGPLADALEGFRPRREQLEMAEAVSDAIEARTSLVVEAGTGTGKTFAYLVPALLSGRQVIVSTGTRTLQDQLYHRDLPTLAGALGRPVRIALLKGRANYLCRHRLQVALAAPELSGVGGGRGRALRHIAKWAEVTRAGDVAELESVPEQDPAWALATSTRENCLGQECPQYRECHVLLARREAQAADLVIVNHHLLLADMALREEGFGEVLPGTDAVILDEAHQFPEVAAQFFGQSFGARNVLALARDTLAELTRAGLLEAGLRGRVESLEPRVGDAQRALAGLGERVDWDRLPDAFLEALDELLEGLEFLHAGLADPGLEAPGVRQCARRAHELATRAREIQSRGAEDGLRWAEWTPRAFSLQFTPFEVAARLATYRAARPCAWIYTSATLAVGEDFSHFAARVGEEGARTRLIPSPFDYPRQSRLYLPRGLPEPTDRAHTGAVIDAALPLIRAAGGRAFVLFTSHRALVEGANVLRARLGANDTFPVLVQGDAPRDALLRRFRELGNAVLLGTGSFWEGVDVRGPALSLVVIDKLPFASPDDPLLKARLEGLRRQGRNPFVEYQLPQAVLALKQGVGRLIRDPEDTGVVVLADPRVRTKGYGRAFLASLPPMTVVEDPGEAVRFLRDSLGSLAPREIA